MCSFCFFYVSLDCASYNFIILKKLRTIKLWEHAITMISFIASDVIDVLIQNIESLIPHSLTIFQSCNQSNQSLVVDDKTFNFAK